jgi:hypothetical protein
MSRFFVAQSFPVPVAPDFPLLPALLPAQSSSSFFIFIFISFSSSFLFYSALHPLCFPLCFPLPMRTLGLCLLLVWCSHSVCVHARQAPSVSPLAAWLAELQFTVQSQQVRSHPVHDTEAGFACGCTKGVNAERDTCIL